MITRSLFAALALATLAAPFAARADAPSGQINTIYAIDEHAAMNFKVTDRNQHRNYVEGDQNVPKAVAVDRTKVREELKKMPQERVGG